MYTLYFRVLVNCLPTGLSSRPIFRFMKVFEETSGSSSGGGIKTSSSDSIRNSTCLELKRDETEIIAPESATVKCPCAGVRLWSTIYSVLTSAILSFLVGITLSYSSPALLELTQLENQDFRFGSTLSDIFGVSVPFCPVY